MNSSPQPDVLIIGGGLAGAATAYALAARSLSVSILEAGSELASKASGNPRGLLMPYIATSSSPPGQLYGDGFHFSRRLMRERLSNTSLYTECGVLQIPTTKRHLRMVEETTDLSEFAPIHRVTPIDASEITGLSIAYRSFHIAHAGYCSPPAIVRELVSAFRNRITIQLGRRVINLERESQLWVATLSDGEQTSAPTVILCGAHEIASLSLTSWVPLEPIRGQTIHTTSSPTSQRLQTVISYDGYIAPASADGHFVGAHYRHNDMNEHPEAADSQEILRRLFVALPEIEPLHVISSRVCFRASTHDRLPYIGALPCDRGDGIYINGGHGSRGLVTAPLGGEIIARRIANEPMAELTKAATIASAERLTRRYRSAQTT